MGAATARRRGRVFLESPLLIDSPALGKTSSMRTFGLKVLIVIVAALVGAVVIHSLVYLSIDPGSLSAKCHSVRKVSPSGQIAAKAADFSQLALSANLSHSAAISPSIARDSRSVVAFASCRQWVA